MAQVKKFKNPAGQMTVDDDAAAIPAGDQTPAQDEPAKKYGKWIRNGVVYEMDGEKMKSLETYISTLDPDQQIIAADY